MKLFNFILLSLSIMWTLSSSTLPRVELDADGDFLDEQGRKIIFHGFNNVMKSFPYYDQGILNDTRLEMLRDRGFKLVRLGIIWSAAHLGPGEFNTTYLDIMSRIVDKLNSHGMYVIIDMHQDGLSSRYGTYDGMPGWIIDRFPKVPWLFSFPWPLRHAPSGDYWFQSYLTYECQNSFQNLYENVENALDLWKEFWVKVAETFKDKKNILGHELINEPFAGNVFTNPLRLLPGYAGKHNLLPAYDRLVDAIRKVDQETLIFYEPVTWGVFWPAQNVFGTGFDRAPGTDSQLALRKSVLSYHYYCWLLQTANPSTEFPQWKQSICDGYLMKEVFRASRDSKEKTGGGRLLTEFGLCAPDGNEKSINTIECNRIMKMADEQFQSWTYWDSQFFDGNGMIMETPMKSFSRCYPVKTLGKYTELSFNHTDGSCQFNFLLGSVKDVSVPILELFVPIKSHFQETGYKVTLEPDSFKWEQDAADKNIIKIYAEGESFKVDDEVKIKVEKN